jgi:4-amino-4-deoxy-L-arabinose transferase-like glycosyltransferase
VLLAIVALGAVLRIGWVLYVHPDPTDGRFDDTAVYRLMAEYVSKGDGYVHPYSGYPTAAWPPLYPAALGGLFKLAGAGEGQTYAANIVLQVVLLAVAWCIGVELFNSRTAVIATALLAAWPGQVFFASLTLSEPLFTLLFAGAFLAALRAAHASRSAVPWVIAMGVLGGLASLTRGQGLVIVPLAVLIWLLAGHGWRTAVRNGGIAAVVLAATLSPWVARNMVRLDAPVIVSTNLGGNLWIGHHDGATGRMHVTATPPLPSDEELTPTEHEVATDRLRLREGVKFAATHPLDEVRLSAYKVRALYESDATALDWNAAYGSSPVTSARADEVLRRLANGYWFAVLGLGAAGALLLARRTATPGSARMALALPALVVAWTGVHVLFFGDARFHYPLAFALALLAAYAVDAALTPAARGAYRALIICSAQSHKRIARMAHASGIDRAPRSPREPTASYTPAHLSKGAP